MSNASMDATYPTTEPTPDQPGTLSQQVACIVAYLGTAEDARRADRDAAWQACRWRVLSHARRVVRA